jgi:hypothetical protein
MQRTLCNCKPTIIARFTGFYQSPCQAGAFAAAARLQRGSAGTPPEPALRYQFRSYLPRLRLG